MDEKFKPISVNYQRLKRHYEYSLRKYDEAALWDLANVLRNWVDMRSLVDEFITSTGIKVNLKGYNYSKKAARNISDCRYFISLFPGGVKTWVKGGGLSVVPDGFMPGASEKHKACGTLGLGMKTGKTLYDAYTLNYIEFIVCPAGGHFSKTMKNRSKTKDLKPRSFKMFSQWMHSEVIRLRYKNDDGVYVAYKISREAMIKRVANIMGGVIHPEVNALIMNIMHRFNI